MCPKNVPGSELYDSKSASLFIIEFKWIEMVALFCLTLSNGNEIISSLINISEYLTKNKLFNLYLDIVDFPLPLAALLALYGSVITWLLQLLCYKRFIYDIAIFDKPFIFNI